MKSLNSIFYTVHQMFHSWPAGHTYKHLKREVLLNLINERETYCTKLQMHLDKQELSYMDAVLEINARDTDEAIPPALGDFILGAISLTTDTPIYIIYPTVERTQDVNRMPVTTNIPNVEYLFRKDINKAKTHSPDLVVVVYNGLNYYAPTAPREVAAMTCDCTTASTQLEDAVNLIKCVVGDLPPSSAHDSLSKSLRFMGAAQGLLEGASLATGTTVGTGLPLEIPIPKASSAESVAKSAHKRVATAVGEVPPAKRPNESEEAFDKCKKKYADTVAKIAKRDTKLGPTQCPCSLNFDSFQELLQHQENEHPDKKSWKCAHCPSVSNNKGHCWSHLRKHLGKFYFYCDCRYKVTDKKTGVTQNVLCEKGFDEEIGVEFHRETHHDVGRCLCRCNYCDKPQQSLRRKLSHHESCESGPNKDGGPTHWCKEENCGYSCRGTQQLKKHMATDHHLSIGLPVPKQWKCPHCGKEFKSATGQRRHDCLTVKIRKPQKKKETQEIIGNERSLINIDF